MHLDFPPLCGLTSQSSTSAANNQLHQIGYYFSSDDGTAGEKGSIIWSKWLVLINVNGRKMLPFVGFLLFHCCYWSPVTLSPAVTDVGWFYRLLMMSCSFFTHFKGQYGLNQCPSSDVNINTIFIDIFQYLFYWVFYGCLVFWNVSENEVSAFLRDLSLCY